MEQFARLPELISAEKATTILIVYGGGSAVHNGWLRKVQDHLVGFKTVLFGGVEPNPEYSTLMKAVELGRKEHVDFIIALGGGSVIDGVKFISGAIPFNGDPWDVLSKKDNAIFNEAIHFATVLTLPATGSEVNSGAVINRSELTEKRTMGGPLFFPRFSICDPSVVATIPKRQLANGIVDAYMHTLEQYLTADYGNLLQEREAEAVLSTLIEVSDIVNSPDDYRLAYNFMLCASHALNGNLRCGAVTDWATHMIGHELTALYGIDHARTLAIIGPRLFEVQFELKLKKLEQYGRRIFDLDGGQDQVAKTAIERTEAFFHSLGVPTRLSEYTSNSEDLVAHVISKFMERGWTKLGQNGSLDLSDVETILNNCR